jgi:SAM-dependent methyltransferase
VTNVRQAAEVWWEGLSIGLATLPRDPVLGLKRVLLPASYWRTAEFAYVLRQLRLPRGARVLDLGSPKDLSAIFARTRGFEVAATDILDETVKLSRRYAEAQGIDGAGPGKVRSEVQDGRRLTFADNTFDAAFSVSVIEHIPGQGDAEAVRELLRVVKPGGKVVITTPYDTAYRETFVDSDVYERKAAGDPVFWERHYDDAALRDRILSAGGARQADLELWGEGWLRGERALSRLGPIRTALSPLEAALAVVSLRRLTPGEGHPMAAFLTLEKL